jgi:hypothetical protein
MTTLAERLMNAKAAANSSPPGPGPSPVPATPPAPVPVAADRTRAAAELASLLAELDRRGISVIQHDGALLAQPADQVPPELRERLVAAMTAAGFTPTNALAEHDRFENCLDLKLYCGKCGKTDLWEPPMSSTTGGFRWRCRKCDPPILADRAKRHLERIRRRGR